VCDLYPESDTQRVHMQWHRQHDRLCQGPMLYGSVSHAVAIIQSEQSCTPPGEMTKEASPSGMSGLWTTFAIRWSPFPFFS